MKRFEIGRLFRIYEEIKKGKYPSVLQLAKKEEVTERTIKRDIQTLRYTFNIPIVYSKKFNGYFLESETVFPFDSLTAGEILTLFIANNLLKEFKSTPLYDTAKTLSEKLEKLLTEKIILDSKDLEDILSISLQPIKVKKNIYKTFDLLIKAIKERRKVKIVYYTISRDQKNERIIDPYHIYNFEGIWYLVAFCHIRNSMRDFALDRIEKIEILNERFKKDENFNIKEYLEKSFRIYKGDEENIILKFDSYQAKWIKERIWHKSQEIKEIEDGSLILKITGNREEIKRWIFGYGSHVEVLEPESFREEIKTEIRKLKSIYNVE